MVLPLHAKAGDDAVDMAGAAALCFYDDGGVFAQQRLGIHTFALTQQVHIQGEELADLFQALELSEFELVAQRRLNGDATFHVLQTVRPMSAKCGG